jgi:hypothetical protein
VRKFVREGRAGQTPFAFFSESEFTSSPRVDDIGGGDGDGFAFGESVPSSEEKDGDGGEGQEHPKERRVLGDRSNTAGRADAGEAKSKSKKRTTTLDQPPPRTKSARKKRKSSDLSTDHHQKEAEEGLCGGKKRPRTAIQFFVPAFDHDENGGYRDRKHFGLIEGMGGGEG